MTDQKEILAGYQFDVYLYFDEKLLNYVSTKSLGRFTAKNGIHISYQKGNIPGFENTGDNYLFINHTFIGKRSLTKEFANLDKFLAKKDKIIEAIKELKEEYQKTVQLPDIGGLQII